MYDLVFRPYRSHMPDVLMLFPWSPGLARLQQELPHQQPKPAITEWVLLNSQEMREENKIVIGNNLWRP